MEEYIEMCSQYGSQAKMTNEEMKEHCTKLFPTLKSINKQFQTSSYNYHFLIFLLVFQSLLFLQFH